MSSDGRLVRRVLCVVGTAVLAAGVARGQSPRLPAVPLPEHPRPDLQRAEWLNLNGQWHFAFDSTDRGVAAETGKSPTESSRKAVKAAGKAAAAAIGARLLKEVGDFGTRAAAKK